MATQAVLVQARLGGDVEEEVTVLRELVRILLVFHQLVYPTL